MSFMVGISRLLCNRELQGSVHCCCCYCCFHIEAPSQPLSVGNDFLGVRPTQLWYMNANIRANAFVWSRSRRGEKRFPWQEDKPMGSTSGFETGEVSTGYRFDSPTMAQIEKSVWPNISTSSFHGSDENEQDYGIYLCG